MNGINKTLYIPLYGKASVSKKGIILQDKKAEMIWKKEGFDLKGKAKSKWLTYYMGMRSAVFDAWVKKMLQKYPSACVLHIGCGMDSRIERIGAKQNVWYDIDFPVVIEERKKYYTETENYHMLSEDASKTEWIAALPKTDQAIIIMEGVSMYLKLQELVALWNALKEHFGNIHFFMDCYTEFAAKASKYKNPIKTVGAQTVYGLDQPKYLEKQTGIRFVKEHDMTPIELIHELKGFEREFFKHVFGGKLSKKMYRLFEYEACKEQKFY